MFKILYNDKVVGQAEIAKEGLYYRIHCACTLPNSSIHRITVKDGENVLDLGICVPVDDKFVVNARIPVKYIKGESPEFYLVSGANKGIPVATGKPFSQLDKLETARLQVTNGQSEIIIDSTLNQQDSDQNPEYPHISESL